MWWEIHMIWAQSADRRHCPSSSLLSSYSCSGSYCAVESKAPRAPQRREGAPVPLHCYLPSAWNLEDAKEEGCPSPSPSSIPSCRTLVPLPLRAGWSSTCAWIPAQGGLSLERFPAGVTGQERGKYPFGAKRSPRGRQKAKKQEGTEDGDIGCW